MRVVITVVAAPEMAYEDVILGELGEEESSAWEQSRGLGTKSPGQCD